MAAFTFARWAAFAHAVGLANRRLQVALLAPPWRGCLVQVWTTAQIKSPTVAGCVAMSAGPNYSIQSALDGRCAGGLMTPELDSPESARIDTDPMKCLYGSSRRRSKDEMDRPAIVAVSDKPQ